jgi:hypothetical protein
MSGDKSVDKKTKAKLKKATNPYVWLMSLPLPLHKFANRAYILTGECLKLDIIATKERREADLKEDEDTVKLISEVVEYQKRQRPSISSPYQQNTIRLLEEQLSRAVAKRDETIADVIECIEALQQYKEIKQRTGIVAPISPLSLSS